MRQSVSKQLSLLSIFAICVFGVTVQQAAAACAELTFDPPANFPGGLQTHGLAVGDLNGDGNVDLAAANEMSGTVTIRFGNGAGGFPTSIQFFVASPSSIAVADFNADGILDFVTSNRGSASITVRLGLGGGAFGPAAQTAVGAAPSGVATSDFNGDGNIDIVASNGTAFSLLLGSAAGSFPTATSVPVAGASGIWGIVAADLNGDGNRDVATLNRGSLNVSVLFGNGSGGFIPAGTYPAGGTEPTGITVGDLNGDGHPDLVTANAGSNNAISRINDGAGAFPAAVTLATGVEPFAVAIGDLDSDGNGDIVSSNRRGRTLSVFRGNGSGAFAPRTDFAVSAGPRAVIAKDLNADGSIDLATGIDTGNIAVLLNTCSPNSAPTISAGMVTQQQDSGSSNSIIATVGDDLDDPVDLAVTVNGGASASVNGVTVSDLAIDAAGNVRANVSASCGASDATFTLAVTDSGGLSATAVLTATVTIETTPPLINKGNPLPDITVYLPLNSPDMSMAVNFDLPQATDNCTASPTVASSPESGSTFDVGTTTVIVTATDELNNGATATFRVNVLFTFAMLPPVDPFPAVNSANAGSAIPVKFSLSGFKGMNVLASGYPASSPVPCGDDEPGPTIEETQTAGGTLLTYDPTTDQYLYIWKTSKDWKRTCRILILRLADGSEHYASFMFR